MFKINNIEWDIQFCAPNSNDLKRSDGSITVGVTDFSTKCVYLSDALHGDFLRKVFIHELCHCAIFSYGFSMDMEQEEFLCDFIASYGDEIFNIVDDLFMVLHKVVS